MRTNRDKQEMEYTEAGIKRNQEKPIWCKKQVKDYEGKNGFQLPDCIRA